MVSSGMRDAGYIYVNIDDTWEAGRDAQGNILTNEKFPDMKALADYVHSQGPEAGHLLLARDRLTCAGYTGSYGHEEQDAKTWAQWGIDYLKYDWCSATRRLHEAKSMRAAYQHDGRGAARSGPADCLQPLPVRLAGRGRVGREGGRQSVAHHGRHLRPLGIHVAHRVRSADRPREVRRAGPLERSRHARDRQRRHDRYGVPHAHEPVEHAGRAAAGGQRHPQHDRRHRRRSC